MNVVIDVMITITTLFVFMAEAAPYDAHSIQESTLCVSLHLSINGATLLEGTSPQSYRAKRPVLLGLL